MAVGASGDLRIGSAGKGQEGEWRGDPDLGQNQEGAWRVALRAALPLEALG